MIDYTKSERARQKFIKNYRVVGNGERRRIIVTFATDEEEVLPYSLIDEVNILRQLHEQAEWVLKTYDLTTLDIVSIISTLYLTIGIVTNTINVGEQWVAAFLTGYVTVPRILEIMEYRKYRYFLKHEDYINEHLEICNKEVFSELSDEQIRLIEKKVSRVEKDPSIPIIGIDIVDKLSLDDLKILRSNIEWEMKLSTNSSEMSEDSYQKRKGNRKK